MAETIVVVSVDTEEDNWQAARDGVTVENIRELPRLQSHCDRLGVPLTYLTNYQVVRTRWAAGILRDLVATGRAEVGAHLHPWNTPPLDEVFVPQNTMMKNLPLALQSAKLATLTRGLENGIGVRPQVFRAGRYGLGRESVQALIEADYLVDSSVTPWYSWVDTDDGPDFVGAPSSAYTLNGSTDPREPARGGPLLEIPLSVGYSRRPFPIWHAVHQVLSGPRARWLRLAGIAARLRVVERLAISPEYSSVGEMRRLAQVLVADGVSHLSVAFHSSSLRPGLSPLAKTSADVERLYGVIADFTEALDSFTTPVFMTMSGAASRLRGPAAAWTSGR